VHVVRHQDVSVRLALETPRELTQVMQKKLVILVRKKAWLTVIAALDDVHRQSSHSET